MLPRESKQLLANVIRHTDTHNRIIEEEECWKQRSLQKMCEAKRFSDFQTSRPVKMQHNNFREDDRVSQRSRAYMDCEDETCNRRYEGREEKVSTFWVRQLDKAESEIPDRWGHSGYKELYPQDFISTDDDDDDDDDRPRAKTKDHSSSKKRLHAADVTTKKHRKTSHHRKTKEKKKTKKKKSRHENDDRDSGHRKSKKRKREAESPSHKRTKKRHKRHKTSQDDLE